MHWFHNFVMILTAHIHISAISLHTNSIAESLAKCVIGKSISRHWHDLSPVNCKQKLTGEMMKKTKVKVRESTVAIGNPEGHVRKASHRGSKQNRSHTTRSLYYWLFAPHTYFFCSSRTSRSWWIPQSTQHHRRGCNSTQTTAANTSYAHKSAVTKTKIQRLVLETQNVQVMFETHQRTNN